MLQLKTIGMAKIICVKTKRHFFERNSGVS